MVFAVALLRNGSIDFYAFFLCMYRSLVKVSLSRTLFSIILTKFFLYFLELTLKKYLLPSYPHPIFNRDLSCIFFINYIQIINGRSLFKQNEIYYAVEWKIALGPPRRTFIHT